MKTLQEQYNLIKEGKGHKDVFLKEAKSKFPGMINNAATYDQATHILKNRSVISENYIDLKPINTIEPTAKQNWEDKFANFLAEAGDKSLNPIVNNDMKANTKESEEKISSDSKLKFEMETNQTGRYKISDGVENIASHNYDYSPKVDNINNVNAQEMMNGVYCEIKNDPKLTLEEAQEKVIKNLAKDELHYVKEGQFGVGIGYTEPEVQENTGKTYGGSGYSDKLKKSDTKMKPIKEELFKKLIKEGLGGVVTSGNPNSLAAQSGNMIRQMMSEDEFQADQAGSQYHSSLYAEEKEEKKLPMDEAPKPDFMDIDGDGDKEESMKKAGKDKKARKPKKESIDNKLAEIGKEAEAVKLEAQLDYLHEYIQEKVDRVSSINEDDNLKELIDKTKMKQMQREIKDLERKKAKMERIYEKSCGKKYAKKGMVDEVETTEEV